MGKPLSSAYFWKWNFIKFKGQSRSLLKQFTSNCSLNGPVNHSLSTVATVSYNMSEITFKVKQPLRSLLTNKSAGLDGIPTTVLKICVLRVQLVPKKESKTIPSNFRLIWLLLFIRKVMKSIRIYMTDSTVFVIRDLIPYFCHAQMESLWNLSANHKLLLLILQNSVIKCDMLVFSSNPLFKLFILNCTPGLTIISLTDSYRLLWTATHPRVSYQRWHTTGFSYFANFIPSEY